VHRSIFSYAQLREWLDAECIAFPLREGRLCLRQDRPETTCAFARRVATSMCKQYFGIGRLAFIQRTRITQESPFVPSLACARRLPSARPLPQFMDEIDLK
jgi:hypothetical protein